MDIKEEIERYIESEEFCGALLLTGRWGCGKTYLINEVCKEYNSNKANGTTFERKRNILRISLFGMDSISTLDLSVKQSYILSLAKIKSSNNRFHSIANKSINVFKKIISDKFSLDLMDLVIVSNNNRLLNDDAEIIIVFDDFERCKLDAVELLGKINEYIEDGRITAIIVSDEERIDDERYLEFKEKVVSHTIKLQPDYEKVIKCIINEFTPTTSKEYKDFLIEVTAQ